MKTPEIWKPFTSLLSEEQNLRVKSASGAWLELEDGRKILDCISSWWVTLHGHCQPEIVEAIQKQAAQLEQAIFADCTHQPAEELVKNLLPVLPEELTTCFFSDNGSTAVEVALKIALQFWQNQGVYRKKKIIAFEGAYHGDTIGAMSVAERSIFNKPFWDHLFPVDFIPYPETWEGDEEAGQKERMALRELETLLENAKEYAAVIIEPLIQGAGGMRTCRPAFLQKLREVCTEKNVLLIYDEVMTGFGRTGEYFASLKSKTCPDVICLSKGITGGFLPLGVTVSSEKVVQAFLTVDSDKTFYHGHSYTANPIACAAAVASLKLLQKEETGQKFRQMEQWHRENWSVLEGEKLGLAKPRFCGTIFATEIKTEGSSGYGNPIGKEIKKKALEKGLLLRPLGNQLYIFPPLCITQKELQQVYQGIEEIL